MRKKKPQILGAFTNVCVLERERTSTLKLS